MELLVVYDVIQTQSFNQCMLFTQVNADRTQGAVLKPACCQTSALQHSMIQLKVFLRTH